MFLVCIIHEMEFNFNICLSLQMTVIDTPDHVHFTPEVKNALRAFDGAVLVLNSVDGVQSHSIVVDKQMVTYELPRLVFINNLDHKGANPWEVMNQVNLLRLMDWIDSRFCTMLSI
jgi:translation elongation factor EF-G